MTQYTKKKSRSNNNKRSKYVKKKENRKTLAGGAAGTAGNFNTLVADIEGLGENVVKAIVNTVELIGTMFETPSDLYQAYEAPAAHSEFTF